MRHPTAPRTVAAMQTGLSRGLSPAASALGLGLGDALSQQVQGETEEQRKKRMQAMQERSLMGPAGSPATAMLFGGSYGQSA